ncbi:hypothetical protein JAAARDRAFT_63301 [Jaapia argillacea MUCL 33604]|uniref:DUF6533 domain-containing protein n=1 Tax=Jaapia argillacea MUCL 33604 TaxID=933084 RepID=A0A067PGV5_9AGAM|nr:hypothetical protein JAAARDRAFT_63301 [Jaapia argillacea MUCL 33604]
MGDSPLVSTARHGLTINCCTVASLTFLVWDIAITLDEEIRYIWSQRITSPTKLLFLFTRHFSILPQIFVFLRAIGSLGAIPSSERVCRSWFTFQCLALQFLILTVELILMLRVYALYCESPRIRRLLIGLVATDLIFIVGSSSAVIPRIRFSSDCTPIESLLARVFFHLMMSLALLIQLVLLVLTIRQSIRGFRSRTPIIYVIMRDSLWVFGIVTAMLLLNGVCYFFFGPIFQSLVFTWFMSILSFSSCRLVLNLSRLGANGMGTSREHPVLTTNLEHNKLDALETALKSRSDVRCNSSMLIG